MASTGGLASLSSRGGSHPLGPEGPSPRQGLRPAATDLPPSGEQPPSPGPSEPRPGHLLARLSPGKQPFPDSFYNWEPRRREGPVRSGRETRASCVRTGKAVGQSAWRGQLGAFRRHDGQFCLPSLSLWGSLWGPRRCLQCSRPTPCVAPGRGEPSSAECWPEAVLGFQLVRSVSSPEKPPRFRDPPGRDV